MAYSHCTGPGQGQGPGNDGFLYYAMYCSYYRGREGQGQVAIVFYCTHPGSGPCPVPGPVQCEWAITV